MSFFQSWPEDAGVRHTSMLNPKAGRALIEFHSAAPRNDGPLEPRQKELIAACVFGLNACDCCFGVLAETAKAFGLKVGMPERLLTNIDNTDLDERLKPLLHHARKLTHSRAR